MCSQTVSYCAVLCEFHVKITFVFIPILLVKEKKGGGHVLFVIYFVAIYIRIPASNTISKLHYVYVVKQ